MSEHGNEIMISLSVTVETEAEAARVVESLSRIVVGFAFDGLAASLMASRLEDVNEDEEML